MSLTYPALLLPAVALAWIYFRFVRRRTIWRSLAVILFVLLVGYPMGSCMTDRLNLIVLVDRSRSIDNEARLREEELLELARNNLEAGDQMTVVSFAAEPHLEETLAGSEDFGGFTNPSSLDASNLADGLRLALELTRPRVHNSMLVLSDGEFTGSDPFGAASLATERNIPIDFRHLGRRSFFDLGISDARGPGKVVAREPFTLEFEVAATDAADGQYRFLRDEMPIGSGSTGGWRTFQFERGPNIITLADIVASPATHRYTLEVRTVEGREESFTENNSGSYYVRVVGEDRVLVVNEDGRPDNVARILAAGGIPVGITSIQSYPFELIYLQGYKAVVLNGVPITGLRYRQIEDIARFVTQEGGGLFVAGGPRSFQAGGFYESPLEEILPVSLEIEQQTRKVATAMAFVLDRSGSMAAQVAPNIAKMDLANKGTATGIELLTEHDSVSVTAVDSLAHVIVQQSPLTQKNAIISKVMSIESMGGGIFVYTGLVAAGEQLTKASQLNKHIVLFSDAMDSEEPGDYVNLLSDYAAAGISVSVIGLGTPTDVDAEFLRDIARRGGGEIYFADDPRKLPQLFSLDTINQTRRSFITDEPAPWEVRLVSQVISLDNAWRDFKATDYNLVYPREDADTALISEQEDTAAGLAFWQSGTGRSVALAFSTEGDAARQPFFGEIVLDSIRWAMGSDVTESFQVSARREGDQAIVELELAEEELAKFESAELVVYSPDGGEELRPMRWAGRNVLEARFPLSLSGPYRGMVRLGDKLLRLDPISLPASPEFLTDVDPDFGRRTLAQIARISGGREVLDVRTLFDRRQKAPTQQPLAFPILLGLLLCLVMDVAEERFAWASRARAWVADRYRRMRGWRPIAAAARKAETAESGIDSAIKVTRGHKRRRAVQPKPRKPEPTEAITSEQTEKPKTGEAPAAPQPDSGFGFMKEAKLRRPAGKPPSNES